MDERFRLYFDDVDISLRMHWGLEVWWYRGRNRALRAAGKPLRHVPAWRWH